MKSTASSSAQINRSSGSLPWVSARAPAKACCTAWLPQRAQPATLSPRAKRSSLRLCVCLIAYAPLPYRTSKSSGPKTAHPQKKFHLVKRCLTATPCMYQLGSTKPRLVASRSVAKSLGKRSPKKSVLWNLKLRHRTTQKPPARWRARYPASLPHRALKHSTTKSLKTKLLRQRQPWPINSSRSTPTS